MNRVFQEFGRASVGPMNLSQTMSNHPKRQQSDQQQKIPAYNNNRVENNNPANNNLKEKSTTDAFGCFV